MGLVEEKAEGVHHDKKSGAPKADVVNQDGSGNSCSFSDANQYLTYPFHWTTSEGAKRRGPGNWADLNFHILCPGLSSGEDTPDSFKNWMRKETQGAAVLEMEPVITAKRTALLKYKQCPSK